MKLLDEYFKLQKQIYDYFSYVEDWRVIPIDDCTDYYWCLFQDKDGSGNVIYNDTPVMNDGNYYSSEIYTQRFLPKWVYRGEDYTMICTDPHTDGNKFLSVFDNNKEIKEK